MSEQYPLEFYMQALDRFVETGECAGSDPDVLYAYLLSVMSDPTVRAQVLGDEVCAKVFYDMMAIFIKDCIGRKKYNWQRSESERRGMELALEWSYATRRDGWQALVEEIESKYLKYGFDGEFYKGLFGKEEKYADEEIWGKMVDDWREAFARRQEEEMKKEVDFRKGALEQRMQSGFRNIPEYLRRNHVDKEEFMQAWGMMNGLWNTVDFERIRKLVRLQRRYPEILRVAERMGRTASDDGKGSLNVSAGSVYKMEHASRCDIEGITVGNDLNALLPSEWAQGADEDLEGLFIYKYLTRKLQNFRYKSEILQPSRRLEVKPSQPRGPMIVCLDTSGSMAGMPEEIAASLLVKLLETADRQKRDCFLIAFSVSIRPIDARRERAKLLDFLSSTACGDTNATRMLQETFRLLGGQKEYMNADVLWVSDFKIPLAGEEWLRRMRECRQTDTRFYGLQIGTAEHRWGDFFEKIYRIDYTRKF